MACGHPLLGADHLGGRVSFTGREPDGTTCEILLPKVRLAADPNDRQ